METEGEVRARLDGGAVRRGEAVVMLTVPRGCNICPAGDDEERLRGRLANNVSSLRESEHFQRI